MKTINKLPPITYLIIVVILILSVLQTCAISKFPQGNTLITIAAGAFLGTTMAFLLPQTFSQKTTFIALIIVTTALSVATHLISLVLLSSPTKLLFSSLHFWIVLTTYQALATLWAWNITSKVVFKQSFARPIYWNSSRDITLPILLISIVGIGLFAIFNNKAFLSWDFLTVILILLLIAQPQYRFFLLDFAPLLFLLLAYESLRGFADNLSPSQIHITDIIALERYLFHGTLPGAYLQNTIPWDSRIGQILVPLSTALYFSHFLLPTVLSIWIWRRQYPFYSPFITGIIALSFAAFLTYLLFPAAPPWWATYYHYLPKTLSVQSYPPPSLMLNGPNPVAAMPSLHMAYPTYQALFITYVWRKRGLWIWLFPPAVGFATLYLGHHYVIDLLAGISYAIIIFILLLPWIAKQEKASKAS